MTAFFLLFSLIPNSALLYIVGHKTGTVVSGISGALRDLELGQSLLCYFWHMCNVRSFTAVLDLSLFLYLDVLEGVIVSAQVYSLWPLSR